MRSVKSKIRFYIYYPVVRPYTTPFVLGLVIRAVGPFEPQFNNVGNVISEERYARAKKAAYIALSRKQS